MDNSVATGGLMLLVVVIIFIAVVVGGVVLMVKGFGKAQQFDRRREVEREVRQGYIDLNNRQNYARKMLNDYEGK